MKPTILKSEHLLDTNAAHQEFQLGKKQYNWSSMWSLTTREQPCSDEMAHLNNLSWVLLHNEAVLASSNLLTNHCLQQKTKEPH